MNSNLKIVTNGHFWVVRRGWYIYEYASRIYDNEWYSNFEEYKECCFFTTEEEAKKLLDYHLKRQCEYK